MTVISLFAQPAVRAIAHLGDKLTYEDITPKLGKNECPYLGHIPYFAGKLTNDDRERLANNNH